MNKAYKVIWSKARNCYVVVSELAKRHAKAPSVSSVKGVVASVTAAVAMSVMLGGYGVAWAEVGDNTNTFKNFANGDLLKAKANNLMLDKEFSNSTGLYPINAHSAYALSYSGKGVILGIREAFEKDDNGNALGAFIDSRHRELKDKVKYEEEGKISNHATHVGGIIAAKKDGDDVFNNMHGVAYDASLYSYSTRFNGNINGAIVAINESYGGYTQDETEIEMVEQWRENEQEITHSYIQQGTVVVHSMGNDSLVEGEPGIGNNTAQVNYDNKEDTNSYISVVGYNPHVDSDDAAFLLYCTSLSQNESETTVSAPGQNINSTVINNKYNETYSGTSMAAPYVTGGIGLVKEAFPYMNNKQLSDTILSTANNNFEMSPFYCNIQREQNSSILFPKYKLNKLRIIIVNDSKTEKPSKEIIGEALFSIYNQYFTNKDEPYENFKNYEEFANYVSGTEGVLDSAFLTREEIFGQGLLDVGKAVQGIGAIDVDRLSDEDISSKYSNKKTYLYQVDTGEVANNYNQRSYSIWSNDIDEKNIGSNNIHAGLLKSGDVDLVLLGDNTGSKGYQGANVVIGGKLQIVRGVKGDVYAEGSGVAEINGAANSVYAVDGGKVVIKDTNVNKLETTVSQTSQGLDAGSAAQLVAGATSSALNKSWYEEALPEKTTVNISGGLFAINKNGQDSKIDVTLKQPGSQIKGPVYQNKSSEINVDLSNGAKLVVTSGTGHYDGSHYGSLNHLNDLSLNSKAMIDLNTYKGYQTLTVNHLYGSNGIFALNTNIQNNSGDKLVIKDAPLNSLQNLQIWDTNLGIEKQENSLLVATAPSSVIFSGYPVDSGVYQYYPILDRTISAGTAKWYFSGYSTSVTPDSPYTTWIDKYTTKDSINKAITSTTNRIVDVKKVDGGDAFVINSNSTAISGNVNFQNQGPVKINLYNVTNGSGIDSTNGNFTAEQPFTIEYKTGMNASNVKIIDNKQNASFGNDLSIKMDCYGGDSFNGTSAIYNEGNLEVLGNTNLYFSDSNSGNQQTESNYGIYNDGTMQLEGKSVDIEASLTPNDSAAIFNKGDAKINSGDIKITAKSTSSSYGASKNIYAIKNSGSLNVTGDTITLEGNIINSNDITINGKEVAISGGNIQDKGKFNITANKVDFGYPESIGYSSGTNILDNDNEMTVRSDEVKADRIVNSGKLIIISPVTTLYKGITNTGNVSVNGNFNVLHSGYYPQDQVFNDGGEFTVNGNISATNITSTGKFKATNLTATKLTNKGEMTIDNAIENTEVINSGNLKMKEGKGLIALDNSGELSTDNLHVTGTLVNNGGKTNVKQKIVVDKTLSSVSGEVTADTISLTGKNAEYGDSLLSVSESGRVTAKTIEAETKVSKEGRTGVVTDYSEVHNAGTLIADLVRIKDGDFRAGNVSTTNVGEMELDGMAWFQSHVIDDGTLHGAKAHFNKFKAARLEIGSGSNVTVENDILITGKPLSTGITNSTVNNSGILKANSLNIENGSLITWYDSSTEINTMKVAGTADFYSGTATIGSLTANRLETGAKGNVKIVGNAYIKVNPASNSDNSVWSSYAIRNQGNLNINSSGKGTVQIVGDISSMSGNDVGATIRLTNSDSYISGSYDGYGASIYVSNGATLEAGLRSLKNTGDRLKFLELSNGGTVALHSKKSVTGKNRNFNNGFLNYMSIDEIQGTGGIFQLGILQDKNDKSKITSNTIYIGKNLTKNAKHTIRLLPTQADFVLTKGTKINPFTVISDSSIRYGGHALSFGISKFDAGIYNYTPTLEERKDDNGTEWVVSDIKATGLAQTDDSSSQRPQDKMSENVKNNVQKTINQTFQQDIIQAVTSNLTKNAQATAVNNYIRLRNEYNNMEKRLGDLRYSNEENGLWARTFHGREDSGKYGFDSNYHAFQIGYDRKIEKKNGGKWFIGGAVTSYDGKTNYVNAGRTENKSVGLALYGSYLGEKGHYVDIVARHSRLNTDLTSYATGTGARITGDYHNWGSSIGVEYGRRIDLKKGYYVQPQAELIYGHVSGGNYSLNDGSRVSQSDISSWTARGGISVGRKTSKGNIYASLSVLHDFGDDSQFTISDKYGKSYSTINNLKDTWYEVSIGGDAKLNDKTYVYADVERTFGGDVRTKWRYNLGVRCSF